MHITHIQLFQTTKIQTFESNSQRGPRRYKLLTQQIVDKLSMEISFSD